MKTTIHSDATYIKISISSICLNSLIFISYLIQKNHIKLHTNLQKFEYSYYTHLLNDAALFKNSLTIVCSIYCELKIKRAYS